MTNKIIPHNLTARAAYNVPGNPPSTRPESGVANCYPGLEYDHRNLDRRFFPGLVLEYVSPADTTAAGFARAGAHLLALDLRDPELRPSDPALAARARALRDALNGDAGTALGTAGARWFVHSIQQAGKTTTVDFADQAGKKLVAKLPAPLGTGAIVVISGKDHHGDRFNARYVIK